MTIKMKPTSFDFGVTDVEHLFIDEFMPYCSLEELQVYLLGLRFAQEKKDINLAGLAKLLHLEYLQVVEAFRYWEDKGLVQLHDHLEDTFTVSYLSLRDLYLSSNYEAKGGLTSLDYSLWHQELFKEIGNQLAYPLSEMECQRLAEFLLGKDINKELVLMAFDEAKLKKNRTFEATKLLSYWAQHGLSTPEEVLAHQERANLRNFQYKEILSALGHPYRQPNIGERSCFDTWLDDYGFTMQQIVEEITRITRSKQNPNLNYLDAVFKNLYHGDDKKEEQSQTKIDEDALRRRLGRKL